MNSDTYFLRLKNIWQAVLDGWDLETTSRFYFERLLFLHVLNQKTDLRQSAGGFVFLTEVDQMEQNMRTEI